MTKVEAIGFMPSCITSWTSASSLFPVCHLHFYCIFNCKVLETTVAVFLP